VFAAARSIHSVIVSYRVEPDMLETKLVAKQPHPAERAPPWKIYNWLINGFDTKDVKEAKALLDEVAGYVPGAFRWRCSGS
jgi:hypothetical protein